MAPIAAYIDQNFNFRLKMFDQTLLQCTRFFEFEEILQLLYFWE